MGRTLLIPSAAMIGTVLLAVAAFWFLNYRASLTPELVLTLPAAECDDLRYGPWGLAHGPEVNRLCNSKGTADGPFFALKGKKAVKIQPHEFHGVHGELQTADAERDVVYVYRYHGRYRPMIEAP